MTPEFWESVTTPTKAELEEMDTWWTRKPLRHQTVAAAILALAAPRIVAETLRVIVTEARKARYRSVTLDLLDCLAAEAEQRGKP